MLPHMTNYADAGEKINSSGPLGKGTSIGSH